MEKIELMRPTAAFGEQVMALREELLLANDADSFAGSGGLRLCETMEAYIEHLEKMRSAATCPRGCVPADTYIAVRRSDGRVVGVVDIRHHIEHPVLREWGGHIGYSVRPAERGKGYGRELLRLALLRCRELGLVRVLVTCNADNVASEHVILANGGVLEREIDVDGLAVRRYWIVP